MPDKLLRNKKGEIIVEALIAITIAIVGLLSIFSFLSQSLSLNRVVGDQYTGSYLAAEGIEIVKNLVDAQAWGPLPCSNPCYVQYDSLAPIPSGSGTLYFDGNYYFHGGIDSTQLTKFTRKIFINSDPPPQTADEIKVISRVEWAGRGGGNYKVELEDHFFNWR